MRRSWAWCLLLAFAGSWVASIAIGAAGLPITQVLAALVASGDETSRAIVRDLRLPRALLGAFVGAALASSGAVLQATLRNPLAEPYLLGVSGGAAVGAVLAVSLGAAGLGVVAVAAFGGALAAVVLVLALGRGRGGTRTPDSLLMAGVVTGAFANAVIMIALSRATPTAQKSGLWWMMGSLSAASWGDVVWMGGALLVAGGIVVHYAPRLDPLALGHETAASLGVHADREALRFFVLASLLAAATVATSGLVGFVGLIVPHLARVVVPAGRHRPTVLVSALGGATLVLSADIIARSAVRPIELPLGAVTAMVGVPFFLYKLRKTA